MPNIITVTILSKREKKNWEIVKPVKSVKIIISQKIIFLLIV
jgi:hypothetical protein